MQNQSDAQLLRGYVESAQETAFRKIVPRHTELVYSAALRRVNPPALARDLAQSVSVLPSVDLVSPSGTIPAL